MSKPIPSSKFDELVAEMEAENPELMVWARAEVKALLSTEEGKSLILGIFVPIQRVAEVK